MHSPLQSPLQPVMRSPLDFRRRGGGSAPFDIASTNPSAYYDRTVLATLFQESAGTTPVTAGSQPIGLGLDQSQGLELGPEKFLYGDGSTTGWTYPGVNGGDVSSVGGELVLTCGNPLTAVTDRLCYAPISGLTIGAWYKVTGGIKNVSDGSGVKLNISPSVTASDSAGVSVGASSPTLTPVTLHFLASATTMYVRLIANNGNASAQVACDNISVKLLAGNHQLQATAGKRPIADGSPIYANFDAVDDDLVATFPASLGAGCTVCRSLPGTGADITTGVTLTDTYTDNVDAHALLIYTAAQWAALDAGQISNITTWLNAKAGV